MVSGKGKAKLAVHNTHSGRKDIRILPKNSPDIVILPQSSFLLEGT